MVVLFQSDSCNIAAQPPKTINETQISKDVKTCLNKYEKWLNLGVPNNLNKNEERAMEFFNNYENSKPRVKISNLILNGEPKDIGDCFYEININVKYSYQRRSTAGRLAGTEIGDGEIRTRYSKQIGDLFPANIQSDIDWSAGITNMLYRNDTDKFYAHVFSATPESFDLGIQRFLPAGDIEFKLSDKDLQTLANKHELYKGKYLITLEASGKLNLWKPE